MNLDSYDDFYSEAYDFYDEPDHRTGRAAAAGGGAGRTLVALLLVLGIFLSVGIGLAYIRAGASVVNLSTTSQTGSGSIISVVEKAADSVVEISTEVKQVHAFAAQLVTEGAGSGVVLSADGYIVTNNHVIDGADTITVTLTDGTKYAATVIGTDEETDLAVLKISASGLRAATFADSDAIQVGQMAVAIGNPLGELGGTVTDGIISATGREITIDGQTMTLLQTSAAVNSGNSGGGLFDSNGNLVGVVNAKSSGSDIEGLAFAIPSNTVAEVAAELIEHGYVSGRPQLGISVVEITNQMTASRYRVSALGVYISQSSAGNGLQAGDRILSIDGAEIGSAADVSIAVDSHAVGDILTVVVSRDGQQVAVRVTLTEKGSPQAVSTAQAA